MKTLKHNIPLITESLLRGIGQLTISAMELIQSTNFDSINNIFNAREHLGTLMRINHGLLVSLGVSHPRLERIRELVDHAGIGWTKLTGAGGGGCAITLCREDVEDETLQELERKFMAEGFRIYKTVLSADGVGVLSPAVFRKGNGREVGEEIDQEKFENAVDAEGIEQLVGVGVEVNRAGWKFWTRADS